MSSAPPVVETTRFHLSLNVNNLAKSIQFLQALLGCEPKKCRADYAKFEPDDLPVVLSLEPRSSPQPPLRNTAGEGPLNHVGFRIQSAAQLVDAQRRLEAAGYTTQREDGVECCYARQTKFWVHDDDRTMWEVYVLEEDLDHRGGEHESRPALEAPLPSTAQSSWTHRLSTEFPAVIPGDGQLDQITLQGSWNARRHAGHWAAQLERVRSALREGGQLILHFLTANEPVAQLKLLPGPASVVEVVPVLSDVLAAVEAAGFEDIQLLKYNATPCFTQSGIQLRETRISANWPGRSREDDATVQLVYRGPLRQITLDGGVSLVRGRPWAVDRRTWQRLSTSPLADSFVQLAETPRDQVACGVQE